MVVRSELAEHHDDFPVAAAGSPTDLEEALGAAIARRVREFRLQLGWTVGQLAAQSGMSKGMLSKIENAQASPSLATLARLSEALQVPVTAFFRGLNEEQDVLYVKAGKGLTIEHKWSGAGRIGSSSGPDPVWDSPTNINARIVDGVISISQYNPSSSWGTTISSDRSQLNTPRYCP